LQRAGAGLHEGLPTNMRGHVAASGNPTAIGVQSGLRTATDKTLMLDTKGRRVAGHSGYFPLPQGGSSNTGGQAAAHDRLRKLPSGKTPHEAVLNSAATLVSTMPHGRQVLASGNLTGGVPNYQGARPMEPPASPGKQPGPIRGGEAHVTHETREHLKQRIATQDKALKRPRSVTPERTPVDPRTGNGGEYITHPSQARPASPLRAIHPGSKPWHGAANQAAYLTAPGRHHPESVTSTIKCPHCGGRNRPSLKVCGACRRPL
jgi:hypothetical protein